MTFKLCLLQACALLCLVTLTNCSGYSPLSDPEAALTKAKKSGKLLLLIFTNRDDCYACDRLAKEVLNKKEWARFAGERYTVCLRDLSSKKKLQKIANEKYRSRYRINRLPMVILHDREGAPYAITGYLKGGASAYLNHLKAFSRSREGLLHSLRRELWNGLAAANNTATTLLDRLQEWGVLHLYPELLHKISSRRGVFPEKTRLRAAGALYRIRSRLKQTAAAAKTITLIRSIDPTHADTLLLRFKLDRIEEQYFSSYRWKEALDALSGFMKKASGHNRSHLYYLQGRCLYQLGRYRESVARFAAAENIPGTGTQKKRLIAQWRRSAHFQLRKSSGR